MCLYAYSPGYQILYAHMQMPRRLVLKLPHRQTMAGELIRKACFEVGGLCSLEKQHTHTHSELQCRLCIRDAAAIKGRKSWMNIKDDHCDCRFPLWPTDGSCCARNAPRRGPPRQTGHSWHTAVVKKIAARWWKDDGTLEGQTQAKQVRSLLSKTDIGINEVC